MAWKALRKLKGYTLGLLYVDNVIVENPDNVPYSGGYLVPGNSPMAIQTFVDGTTTNWSITNNLNFSSGANLKNTYWTTYGWGYVNGNEFGGWTGGAGDTGNHPRYSDFLIFIDDDNQKACFFYSQHGWSQRTPSYGYEYQSNGYRSTASYDTAMYTEIKSVMVTASNGGGASYVSKVSGQLSTLSSNLSDILIVSGGGGGGMIIGTTVYDGKDAGGISGSGSNSGNQNGGYAFGLGESGSGVSGGGSGLYGGYKGVRGDI